MLSCDYNGWNDAPEEEREWADEYLENPGVIGSDRILSAWNQETIALACQPVRSASSVAGD